MKLGVLILASSLIIPSAARAIPEAPIAKVQSEPKPAAAGLDKRVFLTAAVLLAAAQAADLITTRQCLDRGACHELDPLYGTRYPSAERQAGLGIVYYTTRVALFYFTE